VKALCEGKVILIKLLYGGQLPAHDKNIMREKYKEEKKEKPCKRRMGSHRGLNGT